MGVVVCLGAVLLNGRGGQVGVSSIGVAVYETDPRRGCVSGDSHSANVSVATCSIAGVPCGWSVVGVACGDGGIGGDVVGTQKTKSEMEYGAP